MPTFADALNRVIAIQRDAWRNGGKSEAQWRASLRDYAGPLMGRAVDAIGPGDVLGVLAPIWNIRRETAQRVRQRIGAIMKWAIAEGHRESNPVDAIGAALPKNGVHKAHHKALPYPAVGGALATVRASHAWIGTKLAFEFLVLTAARSGEVRGMRWCEVDRDGALWTVPGSRMKAGRDHRVPLSPRAMEVLRQARKLSDGSPDALVFPAPRGGALSDATIGKLLKDRGIDAVPHGFRSSFRDWASERTSTAHAIMEAALAHTIRDKAQAAYARSDLLDKRRTLMEQWARYVTAEPGKVVGAPMRRARPEPGNAVGFTVKQTANRLARMMDRVRRQSQPILDRFDRERAMLPACFLRAADENGAPKTLREAEALFGMAAPTYRERWGGQKRIRRDRLDRDTFIAAALLHANGGFPHSPKPRRSAVHLGVRSLARRGRGERIRSVRAHHYEGLESAMVSAFSARGVAALRWN